MKIPYKKSRNIFNLILGILWLVLFIGDLFFEKKLKWFSIFKLVMSILFLFQYFYRTKKGYFEITDEHIKLFHFQPKEIKIKDITAIKKNIFDEYEIKSAITTIKIATQNLDTEHKDLFKGKIEEIRSLHSEQ